MWGPVILYNQYLPEMRAPSPFTLISFTAFDYRVAGITSFWDCLQLQSIKYQMVPVKSLREHLFCYDLWSEGGFFLSNQSETRLCCWFGLHLIMGRGAKQSNLMDFEVKSLHFKLSVNGLSLSGPPSRLPPFVLCEYHQVILCLTPVINESSGQLNSDCRFYCHTLNIMAVYSGHE